ncbi:hypothetical protein N185_32430 [Sinorhizobium sp. GW3]|nr:hypothetical protein N185_32430 [Sinorhizobium sp. GW3]
MSFEKLFSHATKREESKEKPVKRPGIADLTSTRDEAVRGGRWMPDAKSGGHGSGAGAEVSEAISRSEVLRKLEAVEPNWRWTVPSDATEDCTLRYARQNLQSTSITSAEHSDCVVGTARRNSAVIKIIFVLTGQIKITDRHGRARLHIPSSCVASAREFAGMRMSVQAPSSWMMFNIPEPVLRRHFEHLTGRPYVQNFVLPPTNLFHDSALSLYHTLRETESDLLSAFPEERQFLAKAYQQLALVKLLAKMPHNLGEAFSRGAPLDAPQQVLKAEAFMRENLAKPIALEELADAAGCSVRALQRMFRSYRSDTPLAVLCSYRLAAARGSILAGQAESIADLANSLQFSNPGRFSALYKAAYGVSPSATRRFAGEGRATGMSSTSRATFVPDDH